MSPMVSGTKNSKNEPVELNTIQQKEKNNLIKIRKYIENNFEYVGKNFSNKVREIYYDKKSKKAIYGTTTVKEREELADEGIDLLSIPWMNKDN